MNRNLEELMYEAGLTAQGCWDEMDDYDRAAILKFGELIVVRCMELYAEPLPDVEDKEFDIMDIVNRTCRIAEYFGAIDDKQPD